MPPGHAARFQPMVHDTVSPPRGGAEPMLDARKGFRPEDPARALGLPRGVRAPVALARAGVPVALPTGSFRLDMRPGFLSAAQCAGLIALIDADQRPSTIADDIGEPGYRTSQTCDLYRGHPLVDAVNALLDGVAPMPAAHGEVLQGQRYRSGQEFRRHTDYFEPGGADYARHCAGIGQRVATLMVYLNQPDAGGATRFFALDRAVRPAPGMLVAWRNVDMAGRPDPDSLHAGEPVLEGVKHVITKWYREHPIPPHPREAKPQGRRSRKG